MSLEHYYQTFLQNNPYPRELKNYAFDDNTSFYLNYNGKKLINFSSSDYLGLAKHPLLLERSHQYTQKIGTGSGASRLVSGNFPEYDVLEKKIAAAMGKESALILAAGYQANTSILEALFDPAVLTVKPLVFCDRLCHASLLATTRFLSELKRFQHNDFSHLAELLEKYKHDTRPKFILVESIYSMDGDQVDFAKLIALAKQHHAFLYVDDAHAVGVYGKYGQGKAASYAADIDIIMGTFSKALGSFGAYVACSKTLRDYLINKCKGFIYSTGPSPAILGAMDAALELIPTMHVERQRVADYAARFRQHLKKHHLNYGHSDTHIVPWIIGDADETIKMSLLLQKQGILGTTIRPPSVPVGKSRIRFCLSAAHSEADIAQLFYAIDNIFSVIK